MIKSDNAGVDFEILISTMHKNSLEFLENMFPCEHYSNFNILIINQTDENNQLKSTYENIRVINSFELGLPQSRNLAIKNAQGYICLIADDDVVYKENFKNYITEAHKKFNDADLITFKMVNHEGVLFKNYTDIVRHDKKTIRTANSVVITFKLERLLENNVEFNNNFGLGATFKTANEYVFMRNVLKAGLQIFFEPKIILSHSVISSGMDSSSDRLVFARAALFHKYSGNLSYIRLIRYLYLVCKNGDLKIKDLYKKYCVGVKGISTYKALVKSGLENR